MTAIAYRAGVLAADSEVHWNDYVKAYENDKVVKDHGDLMGIAGDVCPSHEEFSQWRFSKRPRKNRWEGFKFEALVVTADGKVFIYDQLGSKQALKEEFFAIGSGAEVCLGAMEMGATAEQAVAAAIKWCPGVGGEVVKVELDGQSV